MSAAVHNPALLPPGVAPARPVAPARTQRGADASAPANGPSFADVLHGVQADQPVAFSKHALQRLERRGIELPEPTMRRLGDGVERAAAKGSRSSVVLVDGTAFVVSVPNRTVVTAVDSAHMRDQVFTNIDSAVIA
jgi:flagellar operon protein